MKPDQHSKHEALPKDEFGRGESYQWLVILAVPLIIVVLALVMKGASDAASRRIVVYCAQDMNYAAPVFRAFEKSSGYKVAAVYDSEAVKTVGLANRLLAEKANPRCDLFWGNEELRARQLAGKGVFRETNGWAAFGYRTRRIVVNTNRLVLADAPRSLLELTNARWRGRIALAYPQFGSTAAHFHALRQVWGEDLWRAWCRGLKANQPFLMEGNSSVVKLVARGIADIGLTDSDDVAAAVGEGAPVAAQPVGEDTLAIPNTVGLIRKPAISPGAGRLFEYLQQPAAVEMLIRKQALEGFDINAARGATMKPDWEALLRDMHATSRELSGIFLR